MKNLMSFLPTLSAVFFVVNPQNETGIIHRENAGIGASSVDDHSFDRTVHLSRGQTSVRFSDLSEVASTEWKFFP